MKDFDLSIKPIIGDFEPDFTLNIPKGAEGIAVMVAPKEVTIFDKMMKMQREDVFPSVNDMLTKFVGSYGRQILDIPAILAKKYRG